MGEKVKTPVLNKMVEIQGKSQLCGDFLDFLQNKYCMFDKNVVMEQPFYIGAGDYINTEKILAEFFGIDLEQANREKEELLKSLN